MTSLMDQWAAEDETFGVEAAAADAAQEVVALLHDALNSRSEVDQKALAKKLKVTPGRVSQILSGDGNVHISTLAKWLKALNYTLRLNAIDDREQAVVAQERQRTPTRQFRVFEIDCFDETGSVPAFAIAYTNSHPRDVLLASRSESVLSTTMPESNSGTRALVEKVK